MNQVTLSWTGDTPLPPPQAAGPGSAASGSSVPGGELGTGGAREGELGTGRAREGSSVPGGTARYREGTGGARPVLCPAGPGV